jgi:structural maintenance of chromosome 4
MEAQDRCAPIPPIEATEQEEGDMEGSEEKAVSKPKQTSNELQEYSDDELDGLNKDLLNAEITQLEGEESGSVQQSNKS